MFSENYDYGTYSLVLIVLILIALVSLYRMVAFVLKKEKKYLRFTEYFAASGLFLSNLLGLSHFRTSLLNLEYETVDQNLERMAASTIELGIRQDFKLLLTEFSASAVFFVILIVIFVLQNRLSMSQVQVSE